MIDWIFKNSRAFWSKSGTENGNAYTFTNDTNKLIGFYKIDEILSNQVVLMTNEERYNLDLSNTIFTTDVGQTFLCDVEGKLSFVSTSVGDLCPPKFSFYQFTLPAFAKTYDLDNVNLDQNGIMGNENNIESIGFFYINNVPIFANYRDLNNGNSFYNPYAQITVEKDGTAYRVIFDKITINEGDTLTVKTIASTQHCI